MKKTIHYYGHPNSDYPACKVDPRVANADRSTRNEDIMKTTCKACLKDKAFGNIYGRVPGAFTRYQELMNPDLCPYPIKG